MQIEEPEIGSEDPSLGVIGHILASTVGGTATAIAVCPLDVVKTRLQAQPEAPKDVAFLSKPSKHFKAHNTLEGLYQIVRYEGVRTLWRGLTPTILMTVPGVTLYFTLYEQLQLYINFPLFSGALARVVTVLATSPLEMLRTYLQSKRDVRGIGEVTRSLIRTRGFLSLWSGTWPTLIRDVPFSAIYWTLMERLRTDLKLYSKNNERKYFSTTFVAGALSGTIAAIIVAPADVIKTRLQMSIDSETHKIPTTTEITRDLWAREGYKGFFRGIGARVFRVAPACALMISSYELCKIKLHTYLTKKTNR